MHFKCFVCKQHRSNLCICFTKVILTGNSLLKIKYFHDEILYNFYFDSTDSDYTGILLFTLLMWGHIKKLGRHKMQKSRLLSSIKGVEF